MIAKWQGHRDGVKLIMDTYTEVFGDDDSAYEQQQLAKLVRGGVSCNGLINGAPVLENR